MPKISNVTKYRSFTDRALNQNVSVGKDAFRNAVGRMGHQTPSVGEGAEYELVRWTNDYWLMVTLFRNHWIARKIIEIPAKDMVKAWPRLNCELKPDQISYFDRTIQRTLTPLRIKRAITWARLFGGAGALMVIKGHENILDTPLNLDDINPGAYKGLIVFDRWSGITPKGNQAQDIESPLTFGLPEYYTVHGQNGNEALFDVHASRILRFVGPDLPTPEHEANQYWGLAIPELIMEEMKKRDNASWSILQLLFRAQILTQVNPELAQLLSGATSSAGALTRFQQTMQAQNELLSNQSMLLLGKDGKLESHQYTFGGVADVLDRFEIALAACSIPSIPYSKLFGKNSSGLDNSNDADERNYEESIATAQNDDLKPQLMQQLYPVICMSEFGEVPDDLDIKFPSIRVLSEENKSDLTKAGVEAILAPFNAGVTSQKLTGQELAQLSEKTEIFSNITPEIIEEMDDKPQVPIEVEQAEAKSGEAEFEESGGADGMDADTSNKGRWVTLESGTHVFLRNGTIKKGPKGLEGKSFEKADREQHIENKGTVTKQHKSALTAYQDFDYNKINNVLRGKEKKTKATETKTKLLSELFQHSNLTHNVNLYRGYAAKGKETDDLLNSSPGDEFKTEGFFSTSTEESVAENFAHVNQLSGKKAEKPGVVFKIRAKAGTPAVNAESITGENNNNENEVLLNHGTKYKVINVDKSKRIIEIEIDNDLKNTGKDSALSRFFV